MIEKIRQNRKKIRQKSAASPKYKIPIIAVPKAPMPVHIAYAVPRGIVRMLSERAKKLRKERMKKMTVGQKRVK